MAWFLIAQNAEMSGVKQMLNVANISGNLVETPELHTTSNGKSVTSFTIAVPRDYVPKGEERKTDFIDVIAWGASAEYACNNFKKGQHVTVSGRMQTHINERDGSKYKVVELLANHIYMNK